MRLASARGISMTSLALSGRSILVVEDEPLIALDLRQSLESAGAYVFAATQLPHALQLAGHPDLSAAIVDYRLGQGDSTAICSLLEQRGIPFVFYSGYDDMHEIWPAAVRVPKPADGHRLVEAVAGVLANYARAA
jgi:CheY-like chemotaxis protein